MDRKLSLREAFAYFRMGLVTGIVQKEALVDWADRQILETTIPGDEIIELSLTQRQPYSQVIWLLNAYQGGVDIDLPLKALLARAGLRFAEEPAGAVNIVMGLRLLNAEVYLPEAIRHALFELEDCLESFREGSLPYHALAEALKSFLDGYVEYRWLVEVL